MGLPAMVIGVLVATVVPLFLTGTVSFVKDKVDPPPPETLDILPGWPAADGCDRVSAVAMRKGGPPVTSVELDDFEKDPRALVVANETGVSWEHGVLNLTLSTKGKGKITVNSVVPHVKDRTRATAYDWVLQKTRSCGGAGGGSSVLRFDLDRAELRDVVDGKEAAQAVPGNSMLTGRSVTKDDPAYVTVDVRSCAASYTWTLTVAYMVGGERKTKNLGPFRSAGGVAGVPVYDVQPEESGTGRELVDTHTSTKSACGKRG
ncbi:MULTISPECIES: hypothetical protein [unclassified Streptomyces]|uniref:hypothetical protein n=1 Tax=unclassified Streptomyces TaxID=2593676 RepID=UPI000DBAA6AB|nr:MULTISPECIES: hypothetical protein [unclassified Streptomyces]MYT75155.1 hypothetical protein [Streptomyces sp. SID8367]RAJ77111.1 hypothetical protein K377_05869 [Streptomyces sp. PsTaAH-137]